MKKNKSDDNEKYRKKTFTSPKHSFKPFNRKYQEKISRLHAKLKQEGRFPLPLDSLKNILLDAVLKGADIREIEKAIPLTLSDIRKYKLPAEEIALIDQNTMGSSLLDHNVTVQWHNQKRRDFIKKEKAINGALKLLCNLPKISDLVSFQNQSIKAFNEKLDALQRILPLIIKQYLTLSSITPGLLGMSSHVAGVDPREAMKKKMKPLNQKSSVWNRKIVILVDEFKRIGYSDRQAFTRTGKILKFYYPSLYKDDDPNLVRQRYTYHKRKSK